MANAAQIVLDSGALEGADKFSRETALWSPSMGSPDQVINGAKLVADARGRDTVRNSGMAYGAVALHKDSIVGAQYRLNAAPHWRFLSNYSTGFNEGWADNFQQIVEARFGLIAESEMCWLDAQGVNTLTGLVRLAIGVFLITGEVVGSVEWLRKPNRPINTAFQMVNGDRLSNPQGISDTRFLRRGVERDANGQALAYNFRMGDLYDVYPDNLAWMWERVPAEKPWGRKQVIHIIEQGMMDQTRGISDMVATLKNMRMTKKFAEVTLQNAVINATYAAAIESELPNDMVAAALGQTGGDTSAGMLGVYRTYMGALGEYLDAANNIRIDGAMIPHLFPGTKLNMQPAKTTGGIGTSFEESLLRHTAASLGLSYEEFSRDFSKTNYSSGKAAMGVSQRFMASRKKHVADRLASDIYALVLEEEMANGNVPLPRGMTRDVFYRDNGLAKEAFTRCQWIGSGAGQVDELRETQAAMLRIAGGISTYERECSRLGIDWRELFEQCARERKLMDTYGLTFDTTTKKPTGDPAIDATNQTGSQPAQAAA
jgi:lambda family phage portal protein